MIPILQQIMTIISRVSIPLKKSAGDQGIFRSFWQYLFWNTLQCISGTGLSCHIPEYSCTILITFQSYFKNLLGHAIK